MSDVDTDNGAQHEKDLTIQLFRNQLSEVHAALDAIEEAELLDWATYAEEFADAEKIVAKLQQAFAWAATEAKYRVANY